MRAYKADRQHISWLYVLEVDGRVETEAGQRSQGQDMREGQNDLMQEKGSSGAAGLYVHEAEPGVKRVDKLLPNRQHEGMAEE